MKIYAHLSMFRQFEDLRNSEYNRVGGAVSVCSGCGRLITEETVYKAGEDILCEYCKDQKYSIDEWEVLNASDPDNYFETINDTPVLLGDSIAEVYAFAFTSSWEGNKIDWRPMYWLKDVINRVVKAFGTHLLGREPVSFLDWVTVGSRNLASLYYFCEGQQGEDFEKLREVMSSMQGDMWKEIKDAFSMLLDLDDDDTAFYDYD